MPPPKSAAAAAGDYEDLVARQRELEDEIRGAMGDVVVGPDNIIPPLTAPVPPKRKKGEAVSLVELPPVPEKTDTHWDYLLKEMQWLATDFASERKRHQSSRRRLSNGVRQHFKTQESRAQAAIVQAEAKRRKLAGKLTREVKGWWTKLEKVITYRQKVVYDKSRQQAMNRQLVTLVKQTERYTESLAHTKKAVSDDSSDSEENDSGSSPRRKRRRNNKKRHKGRRKLTIEEALSQSTRRRKVHDYAQLAKIHGAASASEDEESVTMYGVTWESTSDNPSDSSFAPESAESEDDETTLREAEVDEQRERLGVKESEDSFVADPVELHKLQEEQEMDINVVLDRLRQETIDHDLPVLEENKTDDSKKATIVDDEIKTKEPDESTGKKVKFADKPHIHPPDPGADADDDGDASDVEDFVHPDDGKDTEQIESIDDTEADAGDEEDYEPEKGADLDDETTIEAEERLGRDMSYEDELALLQREGEMSVEELRAMYSGIGESSAVEDDAMEVDEVDEIEEKGSAGISELLEQNKGGLDEEEEYEPEKGADIDDETTIEAEEKLGRDMSYEDEIALLQREGEMSVEELRAMYACVGNQDEDAGETHELSDSENLDDPNPSGLASLGEEIDEQENDGDFQPGKEEVDDETTIEAEETLGRDMSYEDEINLLKRESEMSVEELRAAYFGAGESVESDEDEESEKSKRKPEERDAGMPESKRQKTDTSDGTDTEAALAALEASAERARSTLASRPFLLSKWVKLREYQQIGLNWLVSLHSRRLNGILADEMGLGKTLQTITLLAYLAAYKGIWGPHLVVVPTSVILNWETELKRFCPSFKVLCYYGSAKRRKELRTGWTKANVYHVVITSYQLAVQDAFAFKRKRWYYLILDEAQNIKNFQSQRWQTLISFNTQRRLLLSGTPLQNTLMELWSLLHFLMPYIFRSRKEFSYWFANPMSSMIEGDGDQNNDVVNRLHGILRPFILRRLKKDVETQMPGKFEHIVKCQLSRRQMYLYEEFMARSSTRHALKSGSGNFMAMMNVLMQLRKVCNHPDLFEPRSVITPFVLDPVTVELPRMIFSEGPTGEYASRRLLSPLWCGSTGEPGLEIALSHGPIESDELNRLRQDLDKQTPPENDFLNIDIGDDDDLRALIDDIRHAREENRTQMIRFHNRLNVLRCHTECFPYSSSLQRAVRTPGIFRDRSDLNILNTPADLLAMRRSQQGRANDMDQLIKKFVFCVPKAGVREDGLGSRRDSSDLTETLLSPLEEYLAPFRGVRARLSSFFPDKKLIQFDAGKLQTLAELLRELKRGGHKTLIFTQMSKMLDILEAFLNLNGHVYLRLDGSTGIERRQRLMDKFNSDPKIFCFILSTRSGGLGINLTGADTVVFYDTDWNPAMDAQAQDRAHRIGQTREVHVYRLVTEQTIEENILMKAKQKRNLDILVMDRGKFDSSHLFRSGDQARMTAPDSSSQDMYSKSGLQSILGLQDKGGEDEIEKNVEPEKDKEMTAGEMEAAMTTLEDNDDVQALRGAQKEAAEELKEFDESEDIKKDDGDEEDQKPQKAEDSKETDEKAEREALEKEFAAWQTEVGMDNEAIEASLSPIERYGLKLREDIDPFYSLYAVLEYNRKIDEEEEADNEIDIEEIEAEKAEDERQAIIDGDLLVTDPPPDELVRQRNLFQRERARLKANMKRRQMTGENWEVLVDQHSNTSFWYNKDTGEARWDKPPVLIELESHEKAEEGGYGMLPIPSLLRIMSFLVPHPERMKAALVCRQWRRAAMDVSFIHHVYPVEMGAATRSKMHHNHYRSLAEAITKTKQGDTIEFSDGHYWVNEDLTIDRPLRLVGDEYHPANVIIEMNNGSCIEWKGKGGWMEGITFRRPQIASSKVTTEPLIRMHSQSRLHMYACTIDNEGSTQPTAVSVSKGGRWKREGVSVRRGKIEVKDGGLMEVIS